MYDFDIEIRIELSRYFKLYLEKVELLLVSRYVLA